MLATNSNTEEPCLVDTRQGFSVSYKNKLLYSKYNPKKSIEEIVESYKILEGTLILCISPILEYGLEELAKKLPKNCLMIGCEADKKLFKFAEEKTKNLSCSKEKKFILLDYKELFDLPLKLNKEQNSLTGFNFLKPGFFKRVIKIEFSAGSIFYKDFYERLFMACRDSVSQFWKNRVTLIKMGRKYSSNIFKNLSFTSKNQALPQINKPIVVCGAGESALETLKYVKPIQDKLCIIATDVLLPTLKELNMCADYAVCEEAQAIIANAFTGCKNNFKTLICSLSSCASIPKKNDSLFYLSIFCESNFLNRIKSKNFTVSELPPLGSVGLSAIYLALLIRGSKDVPIFFSGMDFSFSLGFSHVKLSMHDKKRRSISYRLEPFYFVPTALPQTCLKTIGKDGKYVFSSKIMLSYAELFRYTFSKSENLFDCGKTGISLGIKQTSIEKIREYFYTEKSLQDTYFKSAKKNEQGENWIDFLKEELAALSRLKNILTGKKVIPQKDVDATIMSILKQREYLYIHFPDGYAPSCEKQFLNRVRIEIDYFIKIIKVELNF